MILAIAPGAAIGAAHQVVSPDRSLVATVAADATGRLTIEVKRHGKVVLAPSPLGVTVDGTDLGAGAVPGERTTPDEIDTSYPHLGHASRLRNRAMGMRLPLRTGGLGWAMDVRAYDDGVAWRYRVPGSGRRKVTGEATAFRLPEGASFWSHQKTGDYQGQYTRRSAAAAAERPFTLPLTAELAGGGLVCLSEADVMGYSGMTLRAAGDGRFDAVFEDDKPGWELTGPIVTPWRVCIAVDDLNALVNSTIVFNLCPPPDPKLFPQGAATPWLRPGRSLWQWWFYSWDGLQWDRQRGFIDAAAELGCQYYTVDDGWEGRKHGWVTDTRTQWDALAELSGYARDKGVKLWVWRDWKRLEKPEDRESFFRRLVDLGVVGVKVDFMNSESQQRLAFYRDTLDAAARHKLMVNFHGANKSAGEQRTWPNEMTREAVFGLEENKGGPIITLEHYAAVPFTACIGGAKDFTPTTFRKGNAGTTQAFQLATAAIYTSPLLCWADRPEELRASPALELIRTLPTVWDESRVLPESHIGQFVAMARRSGDEWWIAVLNARRQPRDYTIQLDFLAAGAWTVVAAQDIPGDPWPLTLSEHTVDAKTALKIQMESAGGYVARLRRVDARSPAGAR